MNSVGAMLQKLEGCLGTSDLNEWEESFVLNCLAQTEGGKLTSRLSDLQVDKVQQVYDRNFGG
jgi:hypothetical protein